MQKQWPGIHKINVVITIKNGSKTIDSKPCPTEVNVAEESSVSQAKSVTLNGQDANGKTLKSGDQIEFKLTTRNSTSSDFDSAAKNFKGEDFFGECLREWQRSSRILPG